MPSVPAMNPAGVVSTSMEKSCWTGSGPKESEKLPPGDEPHPSTWASAMANANPCPTGRSWNAPSLPKAKLVTTVWPFDALDANTLPVPPSSVPPVIETFPDKVVKEGSRSAVGRCGFRRLQSCRSTDGDRHDDAQQAPADKTTDRCSRKVRGHRDHLIRRGDQVVCPGGRPARHARGRGRHEFAPAQERVSEAEVAAKPFQPNVPMTYTKFEASIVVCPPLTSLEKWKRVPLSSWTLNVADCCPSGMDLTW